MKRISLLLGLVLAGFGAACLPGPDSTKAVQILLEAQHRITLTHTLSYHSRFRQVSSGLDDSVFTVEGTIWLETVKTDTIFGYRFHLRGEDATGGPFDYYYDGIRSLELRHKAKQLFEMDPYAENSSHSRAKARTSLVPALDLETDTCLVRNLLRQCKAVTLADGGKAWVITLFYPKNEYGALITKHIYVDKDTYRVTKEYVEGAYNGTTFNQTRWLTDIRVNAGDIRDSIPLTGSYDYAVTKVVMKDGPAAKKSSLEGTVARDFSYPSFGSGRVRLSSFRGKYVLLDFWESWCGWCIDAFPHLVDLDTLYKGKPFQLIAITTENTDQIKTIIDYNHLPYPTLIGDKNVLTDYQVTGRPCYVLIDPAGKIIAYAPGDLEKIKALLKERMTVYAR